jgi:hypothetical protein
MNPRKPATSIRDYAICSVITTLVLLSPAIAFLMFITIEMLADLSIATGARGICAVAVGAIGLVLFRNLWRRRPSGALKEIMEG